MPKPKSKPLAQNSPKNSADRLKAYQLPEGPVGQSRGSETNPPEVKELARAYSEEAIKTLATVMKDKKAPASARVRAANAIIDRAYGKPTQHIEAHVDLIDRLSLSEQEALSAALAVLGDEEPEESHDAEESETHH
jgi:hypothetical protein